MGDLPGAMTNHELDIVKTGCELSLKVVGQCAVRKLEQIPDGFALLFEFADGGVELFAAVFVER